MAKDNNLDLSIDSGDTDNTDSLDMDKFFAELEKEANGAIFDDEPVNPGKTEDGKRAKSGGGDEEVGSLRKELESLKKRYEDSSTEAKRLHQELQQYSDLRDYVPLLRAMREDPGMVDAVKGYLTNQSTPTSIKERLGLGEDFVFDYDEAMSDPNSDSAKLWNEAINAAVDQRVRASEAQIEAKTNQKESLREFKNKMKLTDDELRDLQAWAQQKELTYEDVYYLKNRENLTKKAVEGAIKEREQQLRKMRGVPASMAGTGYESTPTSEEMEIFKAMMQQGDADLF